MKISTVVAVSSDDIHKLHDCIQSAKNFSDEIIVFALGVSEKEVKEHVGSIETQIVKTARPKYIEVIRNKMVEASSGEWVLMLDPDERITNSLSEKLLEVAKEGEYQVVNIPRKNIFFGKWIAHTSWWPDKQLRFFQKGSLSWSSTIHKYPKVKGKVYDLPEKEEYALEHYGYDNLNEFISRHNRYASVEAENMDGQGTTFGLLRMFWSAMREFLRRYIKHQGYLDGFWGFALSYLMAYYKFTVWVKLWHIQEKS